MIFDAPWLLDFSYDLVIPMGSRVDANPANPSSPPQRRIIVFQVSIFRVNHLCGRYTPAIVMQVEEKPCKSIEVVHIIYSQGHNRALLMKIYEHVMICVRTNSSLLTVSFNRTQHGQKNMSNQGTAYVTFRDKGAAMKAGLCGQVVGRC